jgi:hypothetical protein
MLALADHLAAQLHEIPVLIVPTVGGSARTPVSLPGREATATSWEAQAVVWGGTAPAIWSFMLAARVRDLGTSRTTIHLRYEQEAAAILGIPYPAVAQAALIPLPMSSAARSSLAVERR